VSDISALQASKLIVGMWSRGDVPTSRDLPLAVIFRAFGAGRYSRFAERLTAVFRAFGAGRYSRFAERLPAVFRAFGAGRYSRFAQRLLYSAPLALVVTVGSLSACLAVIPRR
jgi:hypothetical protein